MTHKNFWFFLTAIFLVVVSCSPSEGGTAAKRGTWLYMGDGGNRDLRNGDLVRLQGQLMIIHNILYKRDTVIALDMVENEIRLLPIEDLLLRGSSMGGYPSRLLQLKPPARPLDSVFVVSQPFAYEVKGKEYLSSFEPVFTGFWEKHRDGVRDFVTRPEEFSTFPTGQQFTEYHLITDYEQPILLLLQREKSRYTKTVGVLVDSVSPSAFGGRVFQGPDGGMPDTLYFHARPEAAETYTAESFTRAVNLGFSRSALLLPGGAKKELDTISRRPRRSLIDPGDIGLISASFLDDGTVMFLSDDHIVLQGSYVLDLDKGLLTVTDDTGDIYWVFVDTSDGIKFTLPVSVVDLIGGELVGEDNYLRLEVVRG